MNITARTRALITCVSLAGCFTALSARLVHVQVTKHRFYEDQAMAKHVKRQPIFARRGTIFDINGEPLARNEPVRKVVADASLIKVEDRDEMATLLAGLLGMPEGEVLEKLGREVDSKDSGKKVPAPYIVLKAEVADSLADEITAQMAARKMRGIRFEQGMRRVYPNGQMLCHVLGYVNSNDAGVDGVERTMDEFLRGEQGFRYTVIDGIGREIVAYRGQEHSASDGSNVRLTIDMGLQNIVEQELEAAIKKFRPKGATVVMMNPKTGEILALANRPDFNLNEQDEVKAVWRMNLAVSAQVEPGSTFKIVTVAGALNEGKVVPDTEFNCENGRWEWCKLKDSHPTGILTVSNILVHSSNIGVAKIAMRLGDQKFFEYVHRFGFGEQTGVALPGEISGLIHPPHTWSSISITRMPMGQEVTATPLQIVSAMSVIANGGSLMLPQIVHEIADEHGQVRMAFPPREVRRVVSKKTTEQVRAALVEVTSANGTAKGAQVPGYKVAGKTGTAQKLEGGRYSNDKSVCSFVGFLPAEDPAFVLLVLIDEAQIKRREDFGGLVAAPVFARIAERSARYLGLTPSYETPEGNVVAKAGSGGKHSRNP